LDWHLRNQRGDTFLKHLRSDPRFASIPVVVFTTSDEASDLSAAYLNGANGYVVKPATFDELVHCVGDICRYWLSRNRTSRTVETQC
jgi:CheY-like chemotaxis protein